MEFDINNLKWTREPEDFSIAEEKIEIITKSHTDLWQRTYYHFRNDNAPVLQMETEEKYFSFTVKTEFDSKQRFDQCGIVMYLDSENWLKGSIEYENENVLGEITNNTSEGIFGVCKEEVVDQIQYEAMPITLKQEVQTGPAQIISSVSGEPEYYDIEIEELHFENENVNRGLVIKVTDEDLLALTGGIIQGMSGSPIIQDGKIIGAVTHVLVNDPTRGYGIFIENMLGH